jgi:DNA-binding CsgD family transcriptional regulator
MLAIGEVMRLDELGRLLPDIRRAIGGSGALIYKFEAEGPPRLVAHDLAGAGAYAPEHFAADPIHAAKRPLPARLQVVPGSRLVERRRHCATAAYADFYRPNDAEFLASAWLAPLAYGQPGMAGLLLARPRSSGDFEPADLDRFAALVPALAAAVARCRRFEAEEDRRCALEVMVESQDAAVLVFDTRGRLLLASPRAEAFFGSALARGGGELPAPIVAEARKVGALAAAAGGAAPRFQVHVGSVTASFSVVRAASGASLVLCRLDADPLAGLAARCALSPAESEVLALLAEGLSNEQIARRRFVSVETVRTHVKRTLAKLAVPTRVQAALLVRDLKARSS